jgi:hypothetical protein
MLLKISHNLSKYCPSYGCRGNTVVWRLEAFKAPRGATFRRGNSARPIGKLRLRGRLTDVDTPRAEEGKIRHQARISDVDIPRFGSENPSPGAVF